MKIQSNEPAIFETLDALNVELPTADNADGLDFSAIDLLSESISPEEVAIYPIEGESPPAADKSEKEPRETNDFVEELNETLLLLDQPNCLMDGVCALNLMTNTKQAVADTQTDLDQISGDGQDQKIATIDAQAIKNQMVFTDQSKVDLKNTVPGLDDVKDLPANEEGEKRVSQALEGSEPVRRSEEESTPARAAATSSYRLDSKDLVGGVGESKKNQEIAVDTRMNSPIGFSFDKALPSSGDVKNKGMSELSGNYKIQIELLTEKREAVDLVEKNISNVNIKIQPPDNIGKIFAKLAMDEDKASLVILTENAHDKKIMESNLPQLKEQFALSNIKLTNIDVQTSSKHGQEQPGFHGYDQATEIEEKNAGKKIPSMRHAKIKTLIDTYV